jgi:hypothetical protein
MCQQHPKRAVLECAECGRFTADSGSKQKQPKMMPWEVLVLNKHIGQIHTPVMPQTAGSRRSCWPPQLSVPNWWQRPARWWRQPEWTPVPRS